MKYILKSCLLLLILTVTSCSFHNHTLKIYHSPSSTFSLSSPLRVVPPGTVIKTALSVSPGLSHKDLRIKNKIEQALLSKGFNVSTNEITTYEFRFNASSFVCMSEFTGSIVNTHTGEIVVSVDFEQEYLDDWSESKVIEKIVSELYSKVSSR